MTNRLRSKRRLESRKMDSSYAYAEKIDARTARRSARLGEDAAARSRNALRIRRNDRLLPASTEPLPPPAGVGGLEVEVRSAVKQVWTSDLMRPSNLSTSSVCTGSSSTSTTSAAGGEEYGEASRAADRLFVSCTDVSIKSSQRFSSDMELSFVGDLCRLLVEFPSWTILVCPWHSQMPTSTYFLSA